MEILEAIKYFGLPPTGKQFEKFLTANGIAERPLFNQEPTESIDRFNEGFSLIFRERYGFEQAWGQPREIGEMIFSTLQVYGGVNDSGFSEFDGQLPFGLSFKTNFKQSVAIFGQHTTDYESGDCHAYVWYNRQGYTLTAAFLQQERGISFLAIAKDKKMAPAKIEW